MSGMDHAESNTRVRVPLSALDWLTEGIALAALLSLVAMLISDYPDLPEKVPSHFAADGTPDGWSGRGMVLLLPAVAGVVYLLLTVLSRFPQIYNYPFRVAPGTERAHFAAARRLVIRLKAAIVLVFGYITWATIQTAHGEATGLGLWFAPVFLLLIFGAIGVYFLTARRIAKSAAAP